jgi:hypothetical protein
MIDPIIAISLAVAFAITVAAILVTRRAAERADDESGEAEQRYINGGWH